MNSNTTTGLSGFGLKYLAAALMLLDHIQYFFSFTGKIPLIFSWLGRLAAPLFLFCLIEGFVHTHNRKKYFLRIYLISIAMGLIQFSFYNIGSGLVRADGFFPQNQMLASFSILLVVLQGIEWCQKRQWGRGLAAILIPVLLPYTFLLLLSNCRSALAGFILNLLSFTVLPMHACIIDGGTATLLAGVVLYVFRKNRWIQAGAFAAFCLLYDVVRILICMPQISPADFLTVGYEWMEVFAVIPMLCYNKKRGTGSKYFFYWFYPAHIYVLYTISCILYPVIMHG